MKEKPKLTQVQRENEVCDLSKSQEDLKNTLSVHKQNLSIGEQSSTEKQAKILLAKSIIKNWDKASEKEKKEVEKWWKENYGEFE